jgi:hypothetical protein
MSTRKITTSVALAIVLGACSSGAKSPTAAREPQRDVPQLGVMNSESGTAATTQTTTAADSIETAAPATGGGVMYGSGN